MTQRISAALPTSTVYVSGTVNGKAVTWTNTGGEMWEAIADRSEDEIYRVSLSMVSYSGQTTESSFTLYYGLLNLITDRTSADVDLVFRLAKMGWERMSAEERSMWLSGLKGAYNATDLNRVGNAVNYVANRLAGAGYALKVNAKIDWTEQDIPKESEMETYLNNVRTLRGVLTVLPDTPQVPADMEDLTYEEANDIERILLAVDALITNMVQAWFYTSEIDCGEV